MLCQTNRSAFAAVLAILVLLGLAGCVHFVSDYDDILDKQATDTQKEADALLQKLATGGPAASYQSNSAAYAAVLNDLHAMTTRAEANNVGDKNRHTLGQIQTLVDNFVLLRDFHAKHGALPPGMVRNAQASIDVQFESIIKFELAKKRGAA